MKRFWLLAFLYALAAAARPAMATEAVDAAGAARTIRIAIGDWPPYLAENLDGYGFAARLIRAAFAATGVEVDYVFYPWNRALELTRRGGVDATGVWFASAQRRTDYLISAPIVASTYRLYYLKDKPIHWTSVPDLHGLRLGATTGYDYGPAFERAERSGSITVIRASSDLVSLRNLARGHLDGFLLDEHVATYLIANALPPEDRERIGRSDHPLPSRSLHLLISRRIDGGDELLRRFNRGLEQLREDGRYQRILDDRAIGSP